MLTARDLRVRLGDRVVLDGLDLHVAAGEVVALLGANGSGKTTALRAVIGLLPYEGEVIVAGRPLRRPDPTRVACLLQHESVAFDLTVGEVVALGGPGVSKALAAVGLAGFATRTMSTLSGGERQRVHLARCLAVGASLLVLDEPTNHLDLGGRATLRDVLSGRTALVATHDLDLAAHADRVVLLHAGRVLAAGSPHLVLTPSNLAEAFGVVLRRVDDPVDGTPLFHLPAAGRPSLEKTA
ncbi:MAG: ABC transporter ATP-binding protein [Pseudomonadota bacterium]|nr:ABC transporter ATP-binding protein [Pseudomonadota bacterium]